MGKWEAIFEKNEDAIFDALVQAEKQRHEWENGSGYDISVYLQADGSLRQATDTQSSYYPSSDDMICIYCQSTFGEYIDQDSYTKSDIKQAVDQYYYDDAYKACWLEDQRINEIRMDRDLYETYKEWRKISEEMLIDGFSGSVDCGDGDVLQDFSNFAGLKNCISFDNMWDLETEYERQTPSAKDFRLQHKK